MLLKILMLLRVSITQCNTPPPLIFNIGWGGGVLLDLAILVKPPISYNCQVNELTSSGQNNLNNMRPMLGGFQIGLPGLQAAANFANANGYIQEVTNPQQVCTQRLV